MKIEFNPRKEKDLIAAQNKLDSAKRRFRVNKAKTILVKNLFGRGALALNRAGIKSLADATKFTRIEFSKLNGIGPKLTTQISDELYKQDLTFIQPLTVHVAKVKDKKVKTKPIGHLS